jgi:tRNA(Ser,Leu) C12 N-acetylase TAN1
MDWSFLDVAEARRVVEALLEALPLKDYAFNVESSDGNWDVHIEYTGPEGWRSKTVCVEGQLLRDSREADSEARRQLLDAWRNELLGVVTGNRLSPRSAAVDWNVVVTTYPGSYAEAKRLLSRYGEVTDTEYFNVLLLTAPDVGAFLQELEQVTSEDMTLLNVASRIIPAQQSFDFQSPREFEEKACRALDKWIPRLKGSSFYVRMHRRGFKGRLSSQEEERFLDRHVLSRLEEAHSPGRVTFDDPDVIVTVETVGQRAGLACWSREERQRFPFLNLD